MNMLTSSTGPTPCTLSFLRAVWSFLSSAGPACLGATFLRIGALAPPACAEGESVNCHCSSRMDRSLPALPCPALRPGGGRVELGR